jgi:septum formation protein
MLRELSGRTHHVSTGVSLLYQGKAGTEVREASFVETTDVTFHELTDAQIAAYARSGECSDKAGAYAIQGTGRLLVSGINGDYANVVGLPVCRVVREMAALSGDNSEQDIVERLLEVAHA